MLYEIKGSNRLAAWNRNQRFRLPANLFEWNFVFDKYKFLDMTYFDDETLHNDSLMFGGGKVVGGRDGNSPGVGGGVGGGKRGNTPGTAGSGGSKGRLTAGQRVKNELKNELEAENGRYAATFTIDCSVIPRAVELHAGKDLNRSTAVTPLKTEHTPHTPGGHHNTQGVGHNTHGVTSHSAHQQPKMDATSKDYMNEKFFIDKKTRTLYGLKVMKPVDVLPLFQEIYREAIGKVESR